MFDSYLIFKRPTMATPPEGSKANPSRLTKLVEAREQALKTFEVLKPEVQKLYEEQLSLLDDEIEKLIEAGKPKDAWGQTVG
jgi:hypothetical protein